MLDGRARERVYKQRLKNNRCLYTLSVAHLTAAPETKQTIQEALD
jgi:hypothetical protein